MKTTLSSLQCASTPIFHSCQTSTPNYKTALHVLPNRNNENAGNHNLVFTPLRGNKVVASQRVISNNAVFGAHSAAVLCTISDLTKRCR